MIPLARGSLTNFLFIPFQGPANLLTNIAFVCHLHDVAPCQKTNHYTPVRTRSLDLQDNGEQTTTTSDTITKQTEQLKKYVKLRHMRYSQMTRHSASSKKRLVHLAAHG
jgi:hypothetical protein